MLWWFTSMTKKRFHSTWFHLTTRSCTHGTANVSLGQKWKLPRPLPRRKELEVCPRSCVLGTRPRLRHRDVSTSRCHAYMEKYMCKVDCMMGNSEFIASFCHSNDDLESSGGHGPQCLSIFLQTSWILVHIAQLTKGQQHDFWRLVSISPRGVSGDCADVVYWISHIACFFVVRSFSYSCDTFRQHVLLLMGLQLPTNRLGC